jgi:phosphoribosylanthranilate isomerase
MTRVKVCGLMDRRDVDFCVKAGVHMLGFVVEYPVHVPWNLTVSAAGELVEKVPPFVSTCIVTGGEVGKILDIVRETCPDVVQLHYKETLSEVNEISQKLKLLGVKVIKALRMDSKGNCDFEITDPCLAVKELSKTGISAILVDSYTASMPGGTGVVVDLSVFRKIQKESTLPVILAGGLNPDNILPIIDQIHPFAVDVLTGVEAKPGQKDPEKIVRFMRSVQSGMAEIL